MGCSIIVTVTFPFDNSNKEKPFEITQQTKPFLKVIELVKDEVTGQMLEIEVSKDIKEIEQSFESKLRNFLANDKLELI